MIIPESYRKEFKKWIENDDLPHLLLSSRIPGTGKSSLAKIFINETGSEALFLNASLYPNIDILRNKIQNFVSTASFNGKPKIVVWDEAEQLGNSTQMAIRGFIEEFSSQARFILTCNYRDKIIEPIRNRLVTYDFDQVFTENKKELVKQSFHKIKDIMEKEGIEYEKEDILKIIKENYPSIRGMITAIRRYSINGKVESPNVSQNILEIVKESVDAIVDYVLPLSDPDMIYSKAFDETIKSELDEEIKAQIILVISEFQAKSEFVRDKHINAVACLIDIKEILKGQS